MSTKITRKDIEEKLCCDQVTLSKGVFTVRLGFFYTHGRTAEKFEQEVQAAFPTATMLDRGGVWKSFKGGASVANQSHWFVKFTFDHELVNRLTEAAYDRYAS